METVLTGNEAGRCEIAREPMAHSGKMYWFEIVCDSNVILILPRVLYYLYDFP